MPNPAYSFVIVEEIVAPSTEVTRTTTVYKTAGEAKEAYRQAVDAGKRAFLYEQPPVSSFRRKDSQPLSE